MVGATVGVSGVGEETAVGVSGVTVGVIGVADGVTGVCEGGTLVGVKVSVGARVFVGSGGELVGVRVGKMGGCGVSVLVGAVVGR